MNTNHEANHSTRNKLTKGIKSNRKVETTAAMWLYNKYCLLFYLLWCAIDEKRNETKQKRIHWKTVTITSSTCHCFECWTMTDLWCAAISCARALSRFKLTDKQYITNVGRIVVNHSCVYIFLFFMIVSLCEQRIVSMYNV